MKIEAHRTEKCFALSQQSVYMFKVPFGASKQAIAKAVEEEFKVKVDDVRVEVRKGKVQRKMVTKRKAAAVAKADVRLAFVKLHTGHAIQMFETEETKADKKAAKKEEA
ncbi:50S ribosomal protein L23 [Candidatus Saccharibacteria bacterium]|nr:50S ribosomal protein L23 [Candidatus Saccharibacteria bacterium]